MLPAHNRMRRRQEFTLAVRRGKRAGRPRLVAHLLVADQVADEVGIEGNPLVGFIVSKAVGNAVVRNRVQRRLRHLARDRVVQGGPGTPVRETRDPAWPDPCREESVLKHGSSPWRASRQIRTCSGAASYGGSASCASCACAC
jgi:ribonuclease P protein component